MSEDGIVPDTFWPSVQLSDAWLLYIVCQFIAPRQNVWVTSYFLILWWSGIGLEASNGNVAILPTMPTCLHYLSISLSNGGNKTLSSLYCIASQKGAHFIFYIWRETDIHIELDLIKEQRNVPVCITFNEASSFWDSRDTTRETRARLGQRTIGTTD